MEIPMDFHSILFQKKDDRIRAEKAVAPPFFGDLNLDQFVASITAPKQAYNLRPFYYTLLRDTDAISYRHEVLKDLDDRDVLQYVNGFAQDIRRMYEHLEQSSKLSYQHQKQTWFLEAVTIYCEAIPRLADALSTADLESRGLSGFRHYLLNYTESPGFTGLQSDTQQLKADLATIEYCVLIDGDTFKVRKYESEPDYSHEIEETFQKFQQGAVKDHRLKFSEWVQMNHVEAKIEEFVSFLFPEIFARLDQYCANQASYLDETIATFDREIQFYVAYLDYTELLKQAGLKFCYPRVSDASKEVSNYEGFDLVLATKLVGQEKRVVCNDFYLQGEERILVVSGPNQGGKTTFSRTFGQVHYLASIGCCVPGRAARLLLCDELFTHFEREEQMNNLRGKLQDDLVRTRQILDAATANSIIIMNEIFTSTTLRDATFLSEKLMARISELGCLCIWVTFIDELASFDEHVVSMTSTVVAQDPTRRTFKVIRRPADGLSYALSIAEKYQLTYQQLKDSLRS
jgi:DNA mismatch repair protein MutS